jgi:asparagine synthase (glutamine-hydrolysing)
MNDKLSHRGPNGSKVWYNRSVALGHQMLHTTTESLHEILPFEENGLTITADARIDNRKELSEKIGLENKASISDSYFILKAYQKWGENCPEKLLGDFAFVVWDESNQKLFCARDHMGVKPFYYYLSDEAFFFATEIKALLTIPEVKCELNELALASHLLPVNRNKRLTFYKNISTLTPAHTLTLTLNANKIMQYWKLDIKKQKILDSDEEYTNAFSKIFAEAVKCRLRSAHPIGFELSGGLDSSSIVCMAQKIFNNTKDNHKININTFSMVFDDLPQVDEKYYIKKVIEDNDEIKPHFIISDNISPLKRIDNILWHQEEPFYTSNMSIIWNLYNKMKEKHIRVLLVGDGGDETTMSHDQYFLRDLAINKQWKKLINEIKDFSKRSNQPLPNLLLNEILLPFTPTYLKTFYKKFLYNSSGKSGNFIFNKEFTKKLGGIDYLMNFHHDVIASKDKTFRNYHYFLLNTISIQYLIEMEDRIASAFSIEPRYPFFDKRLIEFCYAIPNNMKFRFGWNRYILRISMENLLPKDIQWRPLKKYFDPLLDKNLILFEKNLLEEIIDDNPIIKKFFNIDMLMDIYKNYNSGHDNKNLDKLWQVLIIYLWLKNNKILTDETISS